MYNSIFFKKTCSIIDWSDYNNKKVLEIYKHIIDNTVIIDYDGCLLLNTMDTRTDQISGLNLQLSEGYDKHPITPVFAHPYFVEKLLIDSNRQNYYETMITSCTQDILTYIEMCRRFVGGTSQLQHQLYHKYIFNHIAYDNIFTDDNIDICLKFADYYTLCMSFLVHLQKFDTTEDKFVKPFLDYLQTIAINLGLITIGGSKSKKSKLKLKRMNRIGGQQDEGNEKACTPFLSENLMIKLNGIKQKQEIIETENKKIIKIFETTIVNQQSFEESSEVKIDDLLKNLSEITPTHIYKD